MPQTKELPLNQAAVNAMRDFLTALGIDLKAQGMEETPARVAKLYALLFSGVGKETAPLWGETYTTNSDGMVAIRGIPFCSMCEHHLVPFFGKVDIVYLPAHGKVAGLGKFTNLINLISRRPQLQERMTQEIAHAILKDLSARGVLVSVRAQQLCMSIRGESAYDTTIITTETCGVLKSDAALSAQALALIQQKDGEA